MRRICLFSVVGVVLSAGVFGGCESVDEPEFAGWTFRQPENDTGIRTDTEPPDTGCLFCTDTQPQPDRCNGIDDDGDGRIDEDGRDCPMARPVGVTPRGNVGMALAIADSGAMYVGGANLAYPADAPDKTRATVIQIDETGEVEWRSVIESSEEGVPRRVEDLVRDIDTGPQGHVYVAGEAAGSIEGTDEESGGRDGFVASFTAQGELRWVRATGLDGYERFETIDVGSGRVVAAGYFSPTAGSETDSSLLVANLTLSGGGEIDIERRDADDRAFGVAVDPTGGYFLSGSTDSPFQGGEPEGEHDAFVARYDTRGTFRAWAKSYGSSENDGAVEVAWIGGGKTVAAGYGERGFRREPGSPRLGRNFAVVHDGSGNLQGVAAPRISPTARSIAMDVRDEKMATVGAIEVEGGGQQTRFGGSDAFLTTVETLDLGGDVEPSVRLFGTAGDDFGYDVAVAPDGTVYVVSSSIADERGRGVDGPPNTFLYRFDE